MRRWMLMVFWFALIAAAAPAQSTGVRADGQTERDGGGVGTVVTPKKPVDEGATESRSLPHVVVALQKAKERAGVTTGAERAAALREVREQVGIAADICEELAAGSQSDADEFGKAAEELKQNAKPSLDAKKAVDSALGKAVRIESDLQQRADSAREIAQKNSGSAVAEGQAKFWFAQWKGIERQTTSLRNLTEATTSDAEMLLVEIEALELTARYSRGDSVQTFRLFYEENGNGESTAELEISVDLKELARLAAALNSNGEEPAEPAAEGTLLVRINNESVLVQGTDVTLHGDSHQVKFDNLFLEVNEPGQERVVANVAGTILNNAGEQVGEVKLESTSEEGSGRLNIVIRFQDQD